MTTLPDSLAAAVAPVAEAILSGKPSLASQMVAEAAGMTAEEVHQAKRDAGVFRAPPDDQPLIHTAECAAQHFAPWMIEEHWFRSAVEAVKNGTMRPMALDIDDEVDEAEKQPPYKIYNGIAIIPIAGALMKKKSKFGGTSSVETRAAVRKAVHDEKVKAILLHIDSPGGTVAGTADLAADVRSANGIKPVYAHIEDLGASAAYWVASQARRITANATAEVGSIGTLLVLDDTSGMYAAKGIKVHVISTGKYKGAGCDGAPVTDDHIKMFQETVDDLNEHFLKGVAQGREMSMAAVRAVADGRCHIAAKAKALGLIDEVASLDVVMSFIFKQEPEGLEPEATLPASIPTNTNAPEVSPCGDLPPAVPQQESTMGDTVTQAAPAQNPAAVAAPHSSQGAPLDKAEAHRAEMERIKGQTAEAAYMNGHTAGIQEGSTIGAEQTVTRFKAIIAACPGDEKMAVKAFLENQTPEAVKLAFDSANAVRIAAAERDREQALEIARLRQMNAMSGQPGVRLVFSGGMAEDPDGPMDHAGATAQAEREWDTQPAVRRTAKTRDVYVLARAAELDGTHRSFTREPARA